MLSFQQKNQPRNSIENYQELQYRLEIKQSKIAIKMPIQPFSKSILKRQSLKALKSQYSKNSILMVISERMAFQIIRNIFMMKVKLRITINMPLNSFTKWQKNTPKKSTSSLPVNLNSNLKSNFDSNLKSKIISNFFSFKVKINLNEFMSNLFGLN